MCNRISRAVAPELVTTVKALSVVATRRRAKAIPFRLVLSSSDAVA